MLLTTAAKGFAKNLSGKELIVLEQVADSQQVILKLTNGPFISKSVGIVLI